MRVVLVGSGYVGLVSGACFAQFGHSVVCVDSDASKVERLRAGEVPIYEPGLDTLIAENVAAGRLSFTTALGDVVPGADAVFIAVGTPSRPDGRADMRYVEQAARDIARALDGNGGYTVVVNKSTVPVGTGRRVAAIIREERPDADADVVSNPEFLREGSAIEDFMRPDRVVIGADSERARDVMRRLYAPLDALDVPILVTALETAEVTKYAANAFLATKVSFINEIADLCERVGADVHAVAHGIGLDSRIGRKFLNAGPGYGGSCFPKDTNALLHSAEDSGLRLRIISAVVTSNDERKRYLVDRIATALGGSLAETTVAVLGVSFKPNTDDLRDAPSLHLVPSLQARGASVRAYDPVAMPHASQLLSDVAWADDAYDAASDADAVVLLTEWDEFRHLDLARLRGVMRRPVLIDLRNVYDLAQVTAAGFHCYSLGRGRAGMPPAMAAVLGSSVWAPAGAGV